MSGKQTRIAGVIAMLIAFGGAASSSSWATITDTFDNDTAGLPPPTWTVSAGSGTSANVGPDNVTADKYLEVRDLTNAGDVNFAERIFGAGDTQGFFRFDIRVNQIGNTSTITMLFTPPSLQPIQVNLWAGNPVNLFSRGNLGGGGQVDPNANASVSSLFPTGSWETVTVFFQAIGFDDQIRGKYSVSWNGISKEYLYLNQGGPGAPPMALNRMLISTSGPAASFDLDNVTFVPEPAAGLACVGLGAMLMGRKSRRS